MALSTRAVLSILVGAILIAGVLAPRFGRGVLGSWLLAVGLGGATLWGTLSFVWAGSHPSALPATTYLILTLTTAVGGFYFAQRAINDQPPAAFEEEPRYT
jgi:membrane-bound ClpP family serine protease